MDLLQGPAEVAFLSEYAPSVAAILLTFCLVGKSGVRTLLARGLHWRVGFRWYLVVSFCTAFLYAVSFALQVLFGADVPGFAGLDRWAPHFIVRIRGYSPSLGLISSTVPLMESSLGWTLFIAAFFAIESGGITEEFGWRGFAQEELQKRWSALSAGMVVGLLWALWHLSPTHLFLMQDFQAALAENLDHYRWYILQNVPLGVLYAWVYRNTGGSVLLSILFHASFNSTLVLVREVWPEYAGGYWFIGMLWVAAAGVAWWFGPQTLVRAKKP